MIRSRIAAFAAILALSLPAAAEKKYSPGATDTEIKIGQTMPYSGPASAYGAFGKAEAAYFAMINDHGGVNGRRINLISLDDGYSPPKTVEQTRKLVEQDEVLLIFQSAGTPTNSAIHKYMNAKKVPHLFISTGAAKWGDPKNYPWTMGWQPNYQSEARIYGQYLLKNKPDAKIGVLFQNDDYGKDYLKGLKDTLGDKAAKMIVMESSYEVSDPTIDSQIVALKGSGADTFMILATPKFAAQAIRKTADIGWKPLVFLNNVSTSVSAVLTPAGLDKSSGIITAYYLKDPTDPQWAKDPAVLFFQTWLKKYNPGAEPNDVLNVYGYTLAANLVYVLKTCGDDLTHENIMKVAASMKDVELPMLIPGIKVNTSATDFYPVGQMRLAKFDGKRWITFGDLISGR